MATAYFEMLRWFDDDGPPEVSYRSQSLGDLQVREKLADNAPEHVIKDTTRLWARYWIPTHTLQIAQRVWVENDGVVQTIKDRTSDRDMIGQKPNMTEKEWFLLKIRCTPL
jgi:hypothetical protein